MKIERISIRNFRRLENVTIGIEEGDTVFVGPNNSGKTSATAIFRSFLGHRSFSIHDFTVSKISDLDAYKADENAKPLTPQTAGAPTDGQFDRGRKLAYVCFSRARENLRILLFTPEPAAAREELIERLHLRPEQITIA
jgi:predicted ATP-dependent endonuclease of OLD family